jgi:diamine N-acetyltransferase
MRIHADLLLLQVLENQCSFYLGHPHVTVNRPMITIQVNQRTLEIRRLCSRDLDSLYNYLLGLSDETKSKFGPHSFDKETLAEIFRDTETYSGYVAVETETLKIIAYSIIKRGFLEHDRPRLENYGLKLDPFTDATFAPSVADEWQGFGVGKQLFGFIISGLKTEGVKRMILWGGVQCTNRKAVNYYSKLNFRILGQFEYFGQNYDMIKEIV